MNTSDFEKAGDSNKTRLGNPIKRGDKIIVPLLREDFQERFLAIYDGANEVSQIKDEWRETSAQKDAKEEQLYPLRKRGERLESLMQMRMCQLWFDIQEQYDLWGKELCLGIRDGFALVAVSKQDAPMQKLRGQLGIGFGTPGGKINNLLSESDIPQDMPEPMKAVLRKLLGLMKDLDTMSDE